MEYQREKRTCQNCKGKFVIEPNDFSFYEKMQVPAPTFCPECRLFRRSIWRNEHFLYKKIEERTGNLLFSTYPPESKVKIFEHSYWWSDAWDRFSYGIDYNFSQTFFSQFATLLSQVPLCDRSIKSCVNSDYSNNATNIKNSYLCFNAKDSENVSYGFHFSGSVDCVDFYQTKDSRLCYETFSVVDSERLFWSKNCAHCYNVWFSNNCRNCTDCFGCVNLKDKKYCIFNIQYSKLEYEKEVASLYDGSFTKLQNILKQVQEFELQFPVKYLHGKHNVNVTGDYIYASNNTLDCFEIHNVDNARFSQFIRKAKDVYDFSCWGVSSELIYESASCGESSQNLKFCFECWPSSSNLEYCVDCHSSSYCFGCIGLQKSQYCILNKQYSEEDYFKLRGQIIEHMNTMPYISENNCMYKYGEFFPKELSPFKYDEASTFDYFPDLSEPKKPSHSHHIDLPASSLPEFSYMCDSSIVDKVIGCSDDGICNHRCVGAFKITQMEFDFYQRFNIPLPRTCPNCRFYTRMSKLNPIKLWQRACVCDKTNHSHGSDPCGVGFDTSYAPDRPEVVYCEHCYQQEVV